jgi:competence protein ComEC
MKLCSFRPLCFLALCVIATIAVSMISIFFAVIILIIFFITLPFIKVPNWFKTAVSVLCIAAFVSFIITTEIYGGKEWIIIDPDSGLRGVILRYTKRYLSHFLSEDNANLVYSMMFGDRRSLDFELRLDFNIAGLSHALAVSGMNAALLYAIILFTLKALRVPKRFRILIISPCLLFYAYLCGFEYSILRAVIMFLVFVFAKNNLHSADTLSSLSLAAVIILLIFPLSLKSISFLLSFACVLGIILLYKPIKRIVVTNAAALYLAVTVTTFPFIVYFFGYIPTYGIISSVVLLPILALSFYFGVAACFSYILGAILYVMEPLLTFVRDTADAIGKMPGAKIPVSANNYYGIIFYMLGIIILSRFIFLDKNIKIPVSASLFACYLITVVV